MEVQLFFNNNCSGRVQSDGLFDIPTLHGACDNNHAPNAEDGAPMLFVINMNRRILRDRLRHQSLKSIPKMAKQLPERIKWLQARFSQNRALRPACSVCDDSSTPPCHKRCKTLWSSQKSSATSFRIVMIDSWSATR